MRSLLAAYFARLWRDKVFWLCLGVMLVYALGYMLLGCVQAGIDPACRLEHYYFRFALSIGAFCALFSSMFLGTEYSDGTIRNKIIAGHRRADIYLASLLLTFTATLLILSVWLVGGLIAIPVMGLWQMGASQLALYLAIAVLMIAALSSIFTFVAMQSANKTTTVVTALLLFMGMLFFSCLIDGMFIEPDETRAFAVTGVVQAVCGFLADILPTGQGLQMAFLNVRHPLRMLLSSAFVTAVVTLYGIKRFEQKDLK